jgi:phage terminase large subunit-like protein
VTTAIATLRPKLSKAKREGWAKWIRNAHDERAVMDGCRFDVNLAEFVRKFFKKYLRHSKGKWAGQPFELEPWQWEEIIAPTFGWVRPDGFRRIRVVYIEIAKKNGKSTLGAGVGIYLLVADGEEGAEVYSAATKKDQAGIVHDEAVRMVKASPFLVSRLRVNHSTRVITQETTNSKYAALAADAGGSEGMNIHGLIKDEMHVWTDRPFFESLRYGSAARAQPLDFTITTAGVYDKTSIGWSEHEYAERWLADGVEDQEFLAYIRCADPEADLEDPTAHAKANPSYGTIIDPAEIAKAAKDAVEKSTERFPFMRYRLNIWTEAYSSWLDMRAWDKCDGYVNETALAGQKCYGGLDLASKRDLTAFALLFPPRKDVDPWDILLRVWCPAEGAAARAKNDKVKYLDWAHQGFITLTPGNETDYGAIREQIAADRKRFKLLGVGADPWNLADLRQQADPLGDVICEFQQTVRNYSGPCKKLEVMVLDEKVRHSGHPVLRWAISNVRVRIDANGNVFPNKEKSKDKIDPATGLLMALGIGMEHEEKKSVYTATRGVIAV